MGRAARRGRRQEGRQLSDIFGGQPGDPDVLAAIYDLEHDAVRDDLVFYREMAGRSGGSVIDLGCGSGRLFASFVEGGATRVVGVDGSAALLRRAEARIAASPELAAARAAGRIDLQLGDVRHFSRPDRFGLAILAGVLSHLDGPEEALRALSNAARLLERDGLVVVDGIGPGELPTRDLPLSIDWRREMDGREVVRRSQLQRRETPEGLRVLFSTLVDLTGPDGTIARVPASYRLWYPLAVTLLELFREANLTVEMTYGSHDLDPFGPDSVRCIVVGRRAHAGHAQPGSREA
jgi:SAM-dependent methyltransferase